ncbi:MAG: hypothetical protein K5873_07355 [Treponema sp.]|nr:hypothetical protein [Treponema sp.]
MKRFIFFLGLVSLIYFSACNDFSDLTMPESLAVKTAAVVELPLGEGSIVMREKAGASQLQDILDDNISAASTQAPVVYEYYPKDSNLEVLQYLINYPIKEVPLSIGDENLESTEIETISIPETSFEAPDFSSNVTDTLSIDNQSFTIAELGGESQSINELYFTFNITSPDFNTMTVRSGSMEISITPESSPSDDFSLTTEICLVTGSVADNKLTVTKQIAPSSGTVSKQIANSGTSVVTLDLAGAEIVPNMFILINGSVAGGTLGKTVKYNVSMAPKNLELKKITGLNMTNEELGERGKIYIPESFEMEGLNSSLQEATISDGKLDFYCQLPEGWSGITVEESYFKIAGGINIANSDFNSDGEVPEGYVLYKVASLANKTVTPGSVYTYDKDTVTVGSTSTYTDENISWLKISLNNATIVFAEEGETTELALSGECTINSLSNVKVSLASLTSFSGNEETGLNLSTILSDIMSGDSSGLIDDIEFADSSDEDGSKFSGYIFVSRPIDNESLANMKIGGTIAASYTDSNGTAQDKLYLFGSESASGEMEMKKPSPVFADVAEDSVITDSSVLSSDNYSYKIPDGTICSLLNDKPDNLVIEYDLGLTTGESGIIELDSEALQTLKNGSSHSISISLALVVPLQIKLKDEKDIPSSESANDGVITIKDVLALASEEVEYTDIFKRDSASDSEDWTKYADAIDTMYLSYEVDNELIKNELEYTDASGVTHAAGEDLAYKLTMFTVDTSGNQIVLIGNEKGEKEISIADGQQRLELTKDEITKILKNYPFIPRVKAEITVPRDAEGNSTLQYVPKEGLFGIKGYAHVDFNEEVPITVWEK